jgi:hypothetical protein
MNNEEREITTRNKNRKSITLKNRYAAEES